MSSGISTLIKTGLPPDRAAMLDREAGCMLASSSPAEAWARLSTEVLSADDPFEAHLALYRRVYAGVRDGENPAWFPPPKCMGRSNARSLMHRAGVTSYGDLHEWSVRNRVEYWSHGMDELQIQFQQPPTQTARGGTPENGPAWLPGARLNIVDTCIAHAPERQAIIWREDSGQLRTWSGGELSRTTAQVAAGLRNLGLNAGDAIAIDMPMTAESVAIYLGIIAMGGVTVSIADSFAAPEIRTRLRLGNAKLIFTQDVMRRGGKELPLYEKVVDADSPRAVVLPSGGALRVPLRDADMDWNTFCPPEPPLETAPRNPADFINIMYSSGTTGDPKAIPWTQTTPIKCAADARYHHDIQPGDVLAWPTNLGWMMGPWLIFAALINRASIALYYGAPTEPAFGAFVQDAGVTMLGLVPSIVRAWRTNRCMEPFDWRRIRAFSSTGECSNPEDMLYLMWLAGYKPVIEYCGGTEIGGGYITGSMLKPIVPGTFNTLALGTDAVILDEEGKPSEIGELFIVPPSIGLSATLLNQDHSEVYFKGTPPGPGGETLRRHGDQMERLPNGCFRALGRVDDTMNLGGIKVGSTEVEHVLNRLPGLSETAVVAVSPEGGGPSLLVVYAVCTDARADSAELLQVMQNELKRQLNPLFKIHEVRTIESLPRTASNKVMRRVLRANHLEGRS